MIARRTLLGSALAAPFVASLPRVARASARPAAGPIRLVAARGVGGNADVVARILADALEPVLGQRVLVENNGSASGMRAAEDASNAEPDGCTLLVGTSSQLVHDMALSEPLPADIEITLRGAAMIEEVPMALRVPVGAPDVDLVGLSVSQPIRRRSSKAQAPPAPRRTSPARSNSSASARRASSTSPIPAALRRWRT